MLIYFKRKKNFYENMLKVSRMCEGVTKTFNCYYSSKMLFYTQIYCSFFVKFNIFAINNIRRE